MLDQLLACQAAYSAWQKNSATWCLSSAEAKRQNKSLASIVYTAMPADKPISAAELYKKLPEIRKASISQALRFLVRKSLIQKVGKPHSKDIQYHK